MPPGVITQGVPASAEQQAPGEATLFKQAVATVAESASMSHMLNEPCCKEVLLNNARQSPREHSSKHITCWQPSCFSYGSLVHITDLQPVNIPFDHPLLSQEEYVEKFQARVHGFWEHVIKPSSQPIGLEQYQYARSLVS